MRDQQDTFQVKVKQIDVYSIEARLRKTDKPAWQYIKALKEAMDKRQELVSQCLGVIKEQSKSLTECMKQNMKQDDNRTIS